VPSKRDARAAHFLQCACEGHHEAIACVGLGSLYYHGVGVAADVRRANALYEEACEAGALDGCMNVATSYLHGRGFPRDPKRAAKLYDDACARGSWLSCAALGDLYFGGVGVARDDERAAQLAQMACEHDAGIGCNNLGVIYLRGTARPRDVDRAVSLFERACIAGSEPLGCYNFGMQRIRKDAHAAAEAFRRGCHIPSPSGHVECCASLALLAAAGVVTDVSDTDMRAWLEEGCAEDVGKSCEVLQQRSERR
jgi:TPR repeat protein